MSPEIVRANPLTFNQVSTGPALDPLGTPYNTGYRGVASGVTPAGPGYQEGQMEPWENWSRSQAGRAAQPDISYPQSVWDQQKAVEEEERRKLLATGWGSTEQGPVHELGGGMTFEQYTQSQRDFLDAVGRGESPAQVGPWRGPARSPGDYPGGAGRPKSTWEMLSSDQQGGIREREAARAVPYASMAVRQAMVNANAQGRPITRQQAEFDVASRQSGDPWALATSAGGLPGAQSYALGPGAERQKAADQQFEREQWDQNARLQIMLDPNTTPEQKEALLKMLDKSRDGRGKTDETEQKTDQEGGTPESAGLGPWGMAGALAGGAAAVPAATTALHYAGKPVGGAIKAGVKGYVAPWTIPQALGQRKLAKAKAARTAAQATRTAGKATVKTAIKTAAGKTAGKIAAGAILKKALPWLVGGTTAALSAPAMAAEGVLGASTLGWDEGPDRSRENAAYYAEQRRWDEEEYGDKARAAGFDSVQRYLEWKRLMWDLKHPGIKKRSTEGESAWGQFFMNPQRNVYSPNPSS